MNQEELNKQLLETVSFHGLSEDSFKKVKMLWGLGADIKVKNKSGRNLLQIMCRQMQDEGSDEVAREYVKYIIDSKIDVNERGELDGRTAIFYGKFVDMLLEGGARLDVKDNGGGVLFMG